MNYVQQGYTGNIGIWKYFIIPGLFFGLMALNFIVIFFLDFDVDAIIQQEIAKKGENRFLIENLAPLAIGLILLLFWVKYVHKQTITSLTTSRKKIDWKRIWFAFFFWGILSSGMVLIDYYLAPENYEYNFQLQPFLILAVIAVLLVPLQTSFEEYLFRGYLMQGLGIMTKNKWFPLIFTSVVFGMMHIANPEVETLGYSVLIYYVGTGFFLGIITLMDEGLELALGFHAANNLFTALLVTANWTAFQTPSILRDIAEPELGFLELFLPVFILFPILIFIFAKKYKWTDWNDRLFGKVDTPPVEDYKVIGDNHDSAL